MSFKKHPLHYLPPPSKRRKANQMESLKILRDEVTNYLGPSYELGIELGRGHFGVIRRCTNKVTGGSFACKSISKSKLSLVQDVEDVRTEIEIMKHVCAHPNIVGLKDVYEDSTHVHIIMELCEGGELFDKIVKCGSFSESEAARLIKSLVEVVKYCHDLGVIHRDLKPENILFATSSPSSPIKVADFGLALQYVPGQRFTGTAGSAYYIAPEVLNCDYSKEVDLWSVGVILYVLLSGVPPFWGDTELEVFNAIKECKLEFPDDHWSQISMAAKDLISGLLNRNATTRLTAEQVLRHPWVLYHTCQFAEDQGKQTTLHSSEEERAPCRIEVASVQNVAADRTYRNNTLEDHILLLDLFPLLRWSPRSFPAQGQLDIMLQQGPIESGIESLDLSLSPPGLHSSFLPSHGSSLTRCPMNIVCCQGSNILPALASRESLDTFPSPSTSFFSESPSQNSSNIWMPSQAAQPSLNELYAQSLIVLPWNSLWTWRR